MKKGVLYGVSVGPGDPELVTVKALRVVNACPVIASPRTPGGEMLALDILKQASPLDGKEILPLDFSMSQNADVRERAHAAATTVVLRRLQAGRDVAFLNLGDVSIYATFGYLAARVQAAGYPVEKIPGVPSFCAVAAELGVSLAADETSFSVHAGHGDLGEILQSPGTKVLMKSGRQLSQVLAQLEEYGKLDQAALVCNCGLPSQMVVDDLRSGLPADSAGYFTTIIVKE